MKHSPRKFSFLFKPLRWFGSHRLTVRISYGATVASALIICLSAVYIFDADSLKLASFPKNIEVYKPAEKYYSALTGVEVDSSKEVNQAATAIVLENSPQARPQSGLKNSGVVFEAVAEGGITRFLVIYQQEKPKLIGPVRSLRMYYVDWLAPFNASVAHVGGSASALKEIRNGQYRDIDQFFNSQAYWRSTDRWAPHNVYTSFDRLDALNKSKGYTKSSVKGFARQDGEPAETPTAKNISVNISNPTYNSYFSDQPADEPVSTGVDNMRQKVLGKVKESAKSARKSRHFVPIASAVIVVVVFLFLQYNRVLISNVVAYVSPGSIEPQNIIVSPESGSIEVGEESKLIIPKINVDVPVIYGIGNDHDSQMAAMEKGVAHFAIPGANSRPGQVGNTPIAGHSSNDLFDRTQYKFIFAQLDRLREGDMIYAHYDGVRYSYVVTKKEVVKPTQIDKLVYDTNKPVITLITCTPLGTALNRLLVTAEQVSPDPAQASEAPEVEEAEEASMPGNTPSILQRIFGR